MMPATTIAFTKPRMRDTIVPEARKALARPMRSSAIARFLGFVGGGHGGRRCSGIGVGLGRVLGDGWLAGRIVAGLYLAGLNLAGCGVGGTRPGLGRGIRCPLPATATDVAPDADAEDEHDDDAEDGRTEALPVGLHIDALVDGTADGNTLG